MNDAERRRFASAYLAALNAVDVEGVYELHGDRAEALNRADADTDEFWWAWEKMEDLVHDSPAEALTLIVDAVHHASDEALPAVAASHLESLIHAHGAVLIESVEELARSDVGFRKALSGIWPTDLPRSLRTRIASVLAPPYLPAYRRELWR